MGDKPFNLVENPSYFTTYVRYQTTTKLVISIHSEIKVAKFFSVGVNTPSLDLTNLLFLIPGRAPTVPVNGSVKTAVGGGCVLIPNMSLRFEGQSGLEIVTGEVGKGIVTLTGFQSPTDAIVELEIQPNVTGFPKSVTIPAGSLSNSFLFTFQNQCVPAGNPDDPSEMVPPSPIAPMQYYRVRARLLQGPPNPCWDYQAETPLAITNRFISCYRFPGTVEGPAPPWDAVKLSSTTLKADVDDPRAPSGGDTALINLWFPYQENEPTQTLPVTFTLLDENRQPYGRSDVEVVIGQERKVLNPSCVQNVTIRRREDVGNAPGPNVSVHWRSKGQPSGYSNRFFLLVNAGCQFGQTEFWLDVYNWS
jgi:hypothetical protein